MELNEIPWKRIDDATIGHLEHLTMANDVLVAIGSKFTYEWYQSEYRIPMTDNEGKEIVLSPDGAGAFSYKGMYSPFMIELDRVGTQSPEMTFQKRIKRIETMNQLGDHKPHYRQFPAVLIVTRTESRLLKVKQAIEVIRKNPNIIYLLSTYDDAVQRPMDKNWIVVGKASDKKFSLNQIGYK